VLFGGDVWGVGFGWIETAMKGENQGLGRDGVIRIALLMGGLMRV
jgi:hypothetical protein